MTLVSMPLLTGAATTGLLTVMNGDITEGAPTVAVSTIITIIKVAKIVYEAGKMILLCFGYASWKDFFAGKKSVLIQKTSTYATHYLTNYTGVTGAIRFTVISHGGAPAAQEGTFELVEQITTPP